ncbi:MAG TPA: hypothetical protein VMI73_15335 [Trebonia sp.]|nr:hypothetical protein [Trebonia sp.]
MTDVYLSAVLVASFIFVIGLIQAISRMLERDTDPDDLADEPPDSGKPGHAHPEPFGRG